MADKPEDLLEAEPLPGSTRVHRPKLSLSYGASPLAPAFNAPAAPSNPIEAIEIMTPAFPLGVSEPEKRNFMQSVAHVDESLRAASPSGIFYA